MASAFDEPPPMQSASIKSAFDLPPGVESSAFERPPKSEFLDQPLGYQPDTSPTLSQRLEGLSAHPNVLTPYLEKNLPKADSDIGKVLRGAALGVSQGVEGSISPAGLALFATGAGLPATAAKVLGAAMLAKGGYDIATKTAPAVAENVAAGKPEEATRQIVSTGAEYALPFLAGRGLHGGEPKIGGGSPPESGLVVANLSDNGKIYYGKPTDIHATLAERHPGVEWKDLGFAGPDGAFLTRVQAAQRIGAYGKLDAADMPLPASEHYGLSEDQKAKLLAQKEPVVDVDPQGLKTVVKPSGDVVKELPPSEPITQAGADHVITKWAGTHDLQGIADKLSAEAANGTPIKVNVGKVEVSETKASPDQIEVSLSERDATPLGVYHEVMKHVPGASGLPELPDEIVPHDNTAIANDVVTNGVPGGEPPKPPERPVVMAPDDPGDGPLIQLYNKNKDAADAAAKSKFSTTGAIREKFLESGAQLTQAFPEAGAAYRMARTAPESARQVTRNLVSSLLQEGIARNRVPIAIQAFGDSQLVGMIPRWRHFAEEVGDTDASDMAQAYKTTFRPWVQNIDDMPSFQDAKVLDRADEFAASKNYSGLSKYLQELFTKASDSVGRGAIKAEEYFATPEGKAAKKAYTRAGGVGEFLNDINRMNEGHEIVEPEYFGPLESYFPLAMKPRLRSSAPPSGVFSSTAPNQQMRTGLGTDYDATLAGFERGVRSTMFGAGRAQMVRQLIAQGGLEYLNPGEEPPKTIDIGGKPFSASVIADRFGRQAIVPDFAAKAVSQVVGPREFNPNSPDFIMPYSYMTKLNLLGYGEGINHFWTQVGNFQEAASRMDGPIQARALPFAGAIRTVLRGAAVDPTSPERLSDLAILGKNGDLPSRFGTITTDPEYAANFGASLVKNKFLPGGMGASIFGPAGWDIRMRLALMDLFYNTHPQFQRGEGLNELHKFETSLGNYTAGLEGELGQAMKRSKIPFLGGIQPFYTASSTRLANAVRTASYPLRAMTGAAGEGEGKAFWNGLILSNAVGWAVGNRLLNGKWPWDDDMGKYKIGYWRIPGKDGKDTQININFGNSVPGKIISGLGVGGYLNTRMHGGDSKQAFEQAATDLVNSGMQLMAGPPVQLPLRLLTGLEPRFWNVTRGTMARGEKEGTRMLSLGRLKNAAGAVNPTANEAIRNYTDKTMTPQEKVTKFVIHQALPNLISNPDLWKEHLRLRKEQEADRSRALRQP